MFEDWFAFYKEEFFKKIVLDLFEFSKEIQKNESKICDIYFIGGGLPGFNAGPVYFYDEIL